LNMTPGKSSNTGIHEPFEIAERVRPEDIDELGHVNNVHYLRWVQDAAVAHWKALAPEEDQARLLWVVLRHEIDYKHAAKAGDELIARTWVGESTRISFERLTEIRRAADGQVLPEPAPSGARSTRKPAARSRSVPGSGRSSPVRFPGRPKPPAGRKSDGQGKPGPVSGSDGGEPLKRSLSDRRVQTLSTAATRSRRSWGLSRWAILLFSSPNPGVPAR